MKRHLMMQEVTNILTKAGMNRRELELSYFKEAKRLGVLRRWKTFAGAEFKFREGQVILLDTNYNKTHSQFSLSI